MKIIQKSVTYNGTESTSYYKELLEDYPFVEVASFNETEHIAAYLAWVEVGGVLFIRNMWQSEQEYSQVLDQIKLNTDPNVIIFNTSGTTGTPKLAKYTLEQLEEVREISSKNMRWSKDTVFCNILPAFTAGFWFLVLLNTVEHSSTIVCSTKQSIKQDFANYPVTSTCLPPGMIDFLRSHKIKLDLEKLDVVSTGGSQLLPRHVQYCFDIGARKFMNTYGTTEIGAPILIHESSSMDDYIDCLELTDEAELVDEELFYKGVATGDVFDVVGDNLIRFKGRKNDIVNINGATCSLIKTENEFEELGKYGECVAVVREKMGVQFIEVFYTEGDLNKAEVIDELSKVLSKQGIPRKYTKIDAIPRNALNKKVRRGL